MATITYRLAAGPKELDGHFSVRRAVFVEEQGLFEGTDRDIADDDALHIVAVEERTGQVVGAVRCFPVENGIWYGSRLAVAPDYRRRGGAIGSNLCRVAEDLMVERGASRFLAYIQMQNVKFFEHLGWLCVADPVMHCGVEHQVMECPMHRICGTWQPGAAPSLASKSESNVAAATR